MVTFHVGIGVVNCGNSDSSGCPGLKLGYLEILECAKATLDMDQTALKKLVESISETVKSSKKSELERLRRLFHSLVGRADGRFNNTGLDRNTFRGVLHNVLGMTDDMLANRAPGHHYQNLHFNKILR
nr:EF-hand calcium-binding domain-containing protein 1-like isoform X1 [Macaca nemestrina]